MNTVINVAGIIFLVIILVILMAYLIFVIMNLLDKRREKIESKIRKQVQEDFAARVIDASYWFVSYPSTYNALSLIGRDLYEYGHFDVSQIRDKVAKLGDKKIS